MGYRSNVYAKIKIEHLFELKETLKQADLTDYAKTTADDQFVYVEINEVKWYDSYTDVQIFNNFINSLDEDAGMITIGEDGATETYGYPYDVKLWTETYIEGFIHAN